MRSHTRLHRALSAGAVAVVGLFVMPLVAWSQPGAEITISKDRVQIGDQIQVVGKGFEPGVPVSVQVCGAADKLGRLSCGPGLSDVAVAADGSINQTLAVNEPSGACPCTVVIDAVDAAPVGTRIELVGHPMAKVAKAPEIVVDSAEIESSKGFGHLFGLAPHPSLVLTLRNAGVSPASPTLNLSWRDGDGAPSSIVDPGVPVIEPGESIDFSVPLKYGAFAQGEHTVSGEVVIGDLQSPVQASHTVAPWGLYVLAALALGGGALLQVRKVRTHDEAPVRSRAATPSDRGVRVPAQTRHTTPAAAPEPEPTPVPVAAPPARTAPAWTVPAPSRGRRVAAPGQPDTPAPTPVAATQPSGPMVGPPRLAATPLSPLPGLKPAASVESDTLLAPMVPHQTSHHHVEVTTPTPAPAPEWSTVNVPPRSTTAAEDAATVARAMAAIQARSGSVPAQLPDRYEVSPEPGRRAERGGKRAARPVKGRGNRR